MQELSTADLVVLHLETVREPTGPGPVAERSIAGIGAALGIGDTVADRVALTAALDDARTAGLVIDGPPDTPAPSQDPRGVAQGSDGDVREGGYRLTPAGRERAAELLASFEDETVTVDRGGTRNEVAVGHLADAVPEYSFVAALARTSGGVLRLSPGADDGLIGRESAMDTVGACLSAVEAGRARTVLLRGEAGIGKTALGEATLERAAERGFHSASAAGRRGSGAPFGPVRRALEPHREAMPDRLFEAAEPGADANLEERRRSLFYDVARGLSDLAADQPVALFLDDLDDADPATRALVEFLAGHLEREPVLLVGARTPGGNGDDPTWEWEEQGEREREGQGEQEGQDEREEQAEREREGQDEREEQGEREREGQGEQVGQRELEEQGEQEGQAERGAAATRIDLDGFDRAGTAAFLERVLAGGGVPPGFVDAIHQHTGGNPQVLAETVTYMLEAGTLDPGTGYYPADPSELSIPESVRAMVRDRVDALSGGPREVLEWAGVVGEPVDRDLLGAVVDADPETLRAHLGQLHRVGLLDRGDDGGPALPSDVVRAVVTDGIDPTRRSRMHAAVAEALATAHAENPDARAATIADHYREAGVPAQAIDWYERAGDHAAGQYAYRTAIDAYEQALGLAREEAGDARVLDLLQSLGRLHRLAEAYDQADRCFAYVTNRTDDPAVRGRVAVERARMYASQWEFEAALAVLEPVLAELEGDEPSRTTCLALHQRARAQLRLGDVAASRATVERARDHVQALDAPALHAKIHRVAGSIAAMVGSEDADPTERLRRAVELSRAAGDTHGLAEHYNRLAAVYQRRGNLERSLELVRQSLESWLAVDNHATAADPRTNLAVLLVDTGDFEAATRHLIEAVDVRRAHDQWDLLPKCWFHFGYLYVLYGDVPRGIAYLERGLALSQAKSAVQGQVSAHANLAGFLPVADEFDRALDHADRALELAEASFPPITISARWGQALVYRERGDPEAAVEIHRDLLADGAPIDRWQARMAQRIGLARALVAAGRPDEALDHAERAYSRSEGSGYTFTRIPAGIALGRARHAVGESDRAEAVLRSVRAEASRVESDRYRCEVDVALGEILLEAGDPVAGRAVLGETVDRAEQIGAELYARNAREALADLESVPEGR